MRRAFLSEEEQEQGEEGQEAVEEAEEEEIRGGPHSLHFSIPIPLPKLLKRVATVSKSDEKKQNSASLGPRYVELSSYQMTAVKHIH